MAIATVRQSLTLRFTRDNIGFQAISRQDYIDQHVTEFAAGLYNPRPQDPKAIVYNDCTYINIEKSSCFEVLRHSYCLHKGRHLVKPAVFVAPDGYILDIQGPYYSNAANNDARILGSRLNQDEDIMRNWFEQGDIFIIDRGYRDVIPLLERLGIDYKMPALLDRGRKQFTTEEANQSRIVTKTRWVIEARNGHLQKMFKMFSKVVDTAHVKNLSDFLLIAGAIINRYHGPIAMADANADLAAQMLEKAHELNIVQARVEAENLRLLRGRWVTLEENHVPLFPQLTIDYIRDVTYGVYQLNMAPSYIQDTLLRAANEEDQEHTLQIDLNTNERVFLRLRIYSRFRNATYHQVWISYNGGYPENPENDEEALNEGPIVGYYCTCKSGARTLGTCSHVTAAIWYLGWARHQENVRYPSTELLESVLDASNFDWD